VTAFFAYIPILFKEKIEFYVAIAELSTSLGFMLGILITLTKLGPMIGSLLYNFGGYTAPFLYFGVISTILGLIL
jgi:hypothetical protein